VSDVRVVHEGERLPLRLEAGNNIARVHTRLDDLEDHLAADRMLLLATRPIVLAALCWILSSISGCAALELTPQFGPLLQTT
jgi:hypothetical protein